MGKRKFFSKSQDDQPEVKSTKGLVAKKDFRIFQNDVDISIKAGDDLTDIPAQYLENLRTEQVI